MLKWHNKTCGKFPPLKRNHTNINVTWIEKQWSNNWTSSLYYWLYFCEIGWHWNTTGVYSFSVVPYFSQPWALYTRWYALGRDSQSYHKTCQGFAKEGWTSSNTFFFFFPQKTLIIINRTIINGLGGHSSVHFILEMAEQSQLPNKPKS